MNITRETFELQRRPRFGTANPERMQVAFWEWMIRGGRTPFGTNNNSHDQVPSTAEKGVRPKGHWPHEARAFFNVSHPDDGGPIWTFERFGATRTELPDGRIVYIAGEHEDFYDPDFCIYNDVVVFTPAGGIEIYGYPVEIFPATDFHTATLVEEQIVIVGNLGYMAERRFGHTPVFALDAKNYQITEMETSGMMPGWLSKHSAELSPEGEIIIQGGQFIVQEGGKQTYKRNTEEYVLNLQSRVWRQTTNRRWPTYTISPEDGGLFVLERDLKMRDLVPSTTTSPAAEAGRKARFLVDGVAVFVRIGPKEIEVTIEGDLPSELASKVVEKIRLNAEAAIKKPCVAERI